MNGKVKLAWVWLWIFLSVTITHGRVWHVDDDATGPQDGKSWASAYRTLEQAIRTLQEGDTIRVAQGFYTPLDEPVPKDSQTRKCRSGGPCHYHAPPTVWRVQRPCTIQGGYVGLGDPCHPDSRDAALYPTILSGDIGGNDVKPDQILELPYEITRGDNVNVLQVQLDPGQKIVLEGLELAGAQDSAVQIIMGSCFLENCTFKLNVSSLGGAVQCKSSPSDKLSIRFCTFTQNAAAVAGGAVYSQGSESLFIEACRFLGNAAPNGGAIYCEPSGAGLRQIMNCVFSGNQGAFSGMGTLINCTLAENGPGWGLNLHPRSGTGRTASPQKLRIYNCILWRSGGYGGSIIPGSHVTMSHSLMSVLWPGEGNIEGDPLFVDIEGPDGIVGTEDDDLHLALGSPAINAGSDRAMPQPPSFDLDGRPRSIGTIDMGAFESGRVWHVDIERYQFSHRGPEPEDLGQSPNQPFGSVQRAINAACDGDLILVYPGRYEQEFELNGKAVTIRGVAGPDGLPVIGVTLRCHCGTIRFYGGEGPSTVLENLIIKNCGIALEMQGASPTLRNLTITDSGTGVLCDSTSFPDISNCILWDNRDADLVGCQATYSCIERKEQAKGDGTIAQDPLFADPQQDDYRLRSLGGRLDPVFGALVRDTETSPCIDAGDPASNIGGEPLPHGTRINMGAYGGTCQASLSSLLAPMVTWDSTYGDGVVGVAPLTLRVKAWDADGTVLGVTFYANGQILTDLRSYPVKPLQHRPGEPWDLVWMPPTEGGEFILTAVAIDNHGLSTVSLPVSIIVDPNLDMHSGRARGIR